MNLKKFFFVFKCLQVDFFKDANQMNLRCFGTFCFAENSIFGYGVLIYKLSEYRLYLTH